MNAVARRLIHGIAATAAVFTVLAAPALATPRGGNGPILLERYFGSAQYSTSDALFTVDSSDTTGAGGLGAASATQIPATAGPVNYITPAVSPDGKRVAYAAVDTDGNQRIFVMNIDGSDVHELPGEGTNFDPAWSSDGKQILFSSTRGGTGTSTNLWLMSDTGASPIQITTGTGTNTGAEFSPDNTRIAWAHSETVSQYTQIYVGPLLGAASAVPLTNNSCVNDHPTWSPDGIHVAFHSQDNEFQSSGCAGDNIDVIDITGSLPQKLDNGVHDITKHAGQPNAEDNDDPVWSPDGKQIAWLSARGDPSITNSGFRYGIWLMNADGSNPRLLSNYRFSYMGDRAPSWVTIPAPTELGNPDPSHNPNPTPTPVPMPTPEPTPTPDPSGQATGTAAGSTSANVVQNTTIPPTPTPTPKPAAFAVAVAKIKATKGAATVQLSVPAAGKVTVSGAGIASAKGTAKAGGKLAIKLHLTAAQAKKLKTSHKVTVKVTIRFTPPGGKQVTLKTTLTITS